MRVAIIGVGKMGRWFTKFFLKEGVEVVVADKNMRALFEIERELGVETASNRNAVQTSKIVLICVPMENFEEVIKEIYSYVRNSQVIIDICTFKELPVKVMHKYIRSGITLGMHPFFGPDAKSIKNQNLVLTPISSEEEAFANKFSVWLKGKGARVYIMSPKKHDKLMKRAKSLPYFLRYYFIGPMDRRFPQLRGFHYWIVSLI